MAKLKANPITAADLKEFILDQSDFGFEVSVVKKLTEMGFDCEHGGTYVDPATGKPRVFDIRANRLSGLMMTRLPVECKNLRENNPLLVSCVPRRKEEALHSAIASFGRQNKPHPSSVESPAQTIVGHRLYHSDLSVGKSCDQVGRFEHNGALTSGDSEVYDKWTQALSSASDVIAQCVHDAGRAGFEVISSIVVPVVVVPNNRLWIVDYSSLGAVIAEPRQVNRCSMFVNRPYTYEDGEGGRREFTISHLEFVTVDGLNELIKKLADETANAAIFATGQLQALLNQNQIRKGRGAS